MTKRLSIIFAVVALAAALAACGSSKAPGVELAPGGGATATSVAAATSTASSTATSTTTSASSTATSTIPLPAALKTKPKVVVPTGPAPKQLVVKDLIKGTGPVAKTGSTVTVQYVGVLYKGGKQFDASWNDGSGQPVAVPLAGVIKGWKQGLPGMRVGGRRLLIIPASLGYGAKGSPPTIPANAALVFVIDLHAVS
jgi:peptidylprolyl isomerase